MLSLDDEDAVVDVDDEGQRMVFESGLVGLVRDEADDDDDDDVLVELITGADEVDASVC